MGVVGWFKRSRNDIAVEKRGQLNCFYPPFKQKTSVNYIYLHKQIPKGKKLFKSICSVIW